MIICHDYLSRLFVVVHLHEIEKDLADERQRVVFVADDVEITVHRDTAEVEAEQQTEVFIVLHRRFGDDGDAHALADRMLDAVRVVELGCHLQLTDVDARLGQKMLHLGCPSRPPAG